MVAQGRKRTGAGRWNAAALLAVAVLLVHALVMGWHAPPSMRLLAGLDNGLCRASGNESTAPDQPAAPGDHLQHCPICLSVADGALGPVVGPQLSPPTRVASVARPPATLSTRLIPRPSSFSARAPPATA
jgi:hypothetical protein